jgi:hypothetical protein
MNQDRAKAAEAALKNVETLKKSLTKPDSTKAKTVVATPAGPTKIQASGLPEPVAGTGFVQYIMYFIGGILVLGVVLMIIDRWFFPVFKRTPGGAGYISLPGNDMSDNFWIDLKSINDITIGAQPESTDTSTPPPIPAPLYSTVLASQSTYTITLDVLINDEKPQDLGPNAATNNISRTFFFLGTALDNNNRKVTFTMDNTMNRVHVNVFNSRNEPQSCVIDNVPIHKPFRIGFVKTSYAMEAYLNGLLVKTVQLKGQQVDPMMGDIIYSPQNIKAPPSTDGNAKKAAVTAAESAVRNATTAAETAANAAAAAVGSATAASTAAANVTAQQTLKIAKQTLTTAQQALSSVNATNKVLSTGIQVMNLRLFPYAVMPEEMQARMSDLAEIRTFNPKNTPTSTLNEVSDWWKSLY